MQDEQIWDYERDLWTGDSYHEKIARDALMVVPMEPFLLVGQAAADAMAETPRWDEVRFSEQKIARPDGPEGGLIVIAYRADARRDDNSYMAWCSSTLLRRAHDEWVIVEHQQTLPAGTG